MFFCLHGRATEYFNSSDKNSVEGCVLHVSTLSQNRAKKNKVYTSNTYTIKAIPMSCFLLLFIPGKKKQYVLSCMGLRVPQNAMYKLNTINILLYIYKMSGKISTMEIFASTENLQNCWARQCSPLRRKFMECYNNPALTLLMKYLDIGQRLKTPNFSAFHWSPRGGSLVSISQHFVATRVVHLPKKDQNKLNYRIRPKRT